MITLSNRTVCAGQPVKASSMLSATTIPKMPGISAMNRYSSAKRVSANARDRVKAT